MKKVIKLVKKSDLGVYNNYLYFYIDI